MEGEDEEGGVTLLLEPEERIEMRMGRRRCAQTSFRPPERLPDMDWLTAAPESVELEGRADIALYMYARQVTLMRLTLAGILEDL